MAALFAPDRGPGLPLGPVHGWAAGAGGICAIQLTPPRVFADSHVVFLRPEGRLLAI
jgi:hypothetical protein